MRFSTYISLAALGLLTAGPFSACMSTSSSCEDRGLPPNCESVSGLSPLPAAGSGKLAGAEAGAPPWLGMAGNYGNSFGVAGASGLLGVETNAGASDPSAAGGPNEVTRTGFAGALSSLESAGTAVASAALGGGANGGAAGATGQGVGGGAGGVPVFSTTIAGGTGIAGAAVVPCKGSCQGTKPYCEPETDTCVACFQESQCASTKKHCDIDTYSCVACLQDKHCPLTAPGCDPTKHVCLGCTRDIHCSGSTPGCNTATNECVACTKDDHCLEFPSTPACDLKTNTCVSCTADKYCDNPTPACKMPDELCVGCTQNSHCSGTKSLCKTATNACVECLGKSDCQSSTSGKRACNVSGACVQCTERDDCKTVTGKPACLNETCVECITHADCANVPDRHFCNTVPSNTVAANTCVACLQNADCANPTPVCGPNKTCVACTQHSDCKSPTAPVCNTATNTCGPCTADADCANFPEKGVCSVGACVQCSTSKESPCGGNSCNPATGSCSATPRGSVENCHSCLADSECVGGDGPAPTARCVSMTFNGSPHGIGGYCLQRRATAACTPPFASLFSMASLSGAPAEEYCAFNQDTTTCEAVLDLIAGKTCTADNTCGAGQGGLCKTFPSVGSLRCTIPCGISLQCPSGTQCTIPTAPYCH